MDEQKTHVLEIDLIEWLKEIKKHLLLIVVTTLLFGAAAGAYLYKTTGPTYSYSVYIFCAGIGERDMLTFVGLFQNDIGIEKSQNSNYHASLNSVELVKTGSDSKDIKDKYTNLMKFEFVGNNSDYVKEEATRFADKAVITINTRIERWFEASYTRNYLDTVRNELTRINNTLISGTVFNDGIVSTKNALDWLSRLKETLTLKELTKAHESAYVINAQSDSPRKVGIDKAMILKSAALGFFLSFAFVTCKYLARVFR